MMKQFLKDRLFGIFLVIFFLIGMIADNVGTSPGIKVSLFLLLFLLYGLVWMLCNVRGVQVTCAVPEPPKHAFPRPRRKRVSRRTKAFNVPHVITTQYVDAVHFQSVQSQIAKMLAQRNMGAGI